MRRIALGTALVLVGVHVLMRVFGADEHASVLAGMPQSSASWVIGPLHVLFTLAAVTIAPICVIAAGIDAVVTRSFARHAREVDAHADRVHPG